MFEVIDTKQNYSHGSFDTLAEAQGAVSFDGLRDWEIFSDTGEVVASGKSPRLYWVGLYLEDRAYGGPEEGGWWYSCGELVTDADIYTVLGLFPTCHTDEDTAYAASVAMNDACQELNKDRRDINSVLSDGRYSASVYEDVLPPHFPATRPHYE